MTFKSGNDDVRGDSKSIPDRGTSTGVDDTYGADLSPDATNSQGKMSGTKSQAPFDNMPPGCC